jgi:N-acetylglucosamine kinase-like BadF-type ATPase
LVARRADGRDEPPSSRDEPSSSRDELTEHLLAALGVTQATQIVTAIYQPDFDRARIASLAPSVLTACMASRQLEERLLAPAGEALAEMVVAVARSLGWSSGVHMGVLPLAAAGGFLLSATHVLQALTAGLTDEGYQPAVTLVPDPVRGAVLLAERALARGDGTW